ncbi:MAG: hypothetical protein OJF58_001154 [Enhydrobacter sp.]|nr:MAG: hypothetical protein OJF58_001154 [Enhydrobacter sp.]
MTCRASRRRDGLPQRFRGPVPGSDPGREISQNVRFSPPA